VGDYGLQAGQSLLLAKKSESHPTELADLFRARFVVSSELEDGRRFAEALIKQLTGGDKIRARRMREDLWEFDPTHTVIVAANHKPEVRGTDEGIWRRIKIVPWEVSIPDSERDPDLPRKLEAELEGILAWCVRGALEWRRDGLAEPAAVTQETDEYQKEQDILANFIYNACVEAPNLSVKSERLYIAYKEWCERGGEFQLTQTKFSTRLKERGYEKKRQKLGVVWFGIALKGDGPGPGEGLPPTPGEGLGVDPASPETRIDKPNTEEKMQGCRVGDPKSGSTPKKYPRVEGLTGKTLHHPTTLHPTLHPSYIDSDEQLRDALEGFGGSR
jgi:putative DNA primase/helicase